MMEHVINARQATTAPAMAANPVADVKNTSFVGELMFTVVGGRVVMLLVAAGGLVG